MPALPARIPGPPIPKASWDAKVYDLGEVNQLLDIINQLKKKKITGASVVYNWALRRIQPLQKWANLGFEYTGEDDPSHFESKKISEADALHLVKQVLDDVETMPFLWEDFRRGSQPREVE